MTTPEGPTAASDAAVTTTTPHGTVTVRTTPMTTPNGAATAPRGTTIPPNGAVTTPDDTTTTPHNAVTAPHGAPRTSSAQGDAVGRLAGAAPHRGALSPAYDHFERHQEDGPVTATTRR